ncbi:MAG: hypothetical protein AB4050_00480 [Synechococcus sp.]
MTLQATYRGLPFQSQSFETVETKQQAMFLGRKAYISSPMKPHVSLPADIQFFGHRTTKAIAPQTVGINSDGLVPA